MRIALTGASGFIGSVLCRRLAAKGHSVTALVRETSRRDHIEAHVDRFVVGDQADESAWPELLDGADGVIHNSVDWRPLRDPDGWDEDPLRNLDASVRLLLKSGSRRFVFMSTIAVHHDMRPRWKGLIDEDHPLRPNTLYGAYKASVEAYLWVEHFSRGRHVAAIRPSGVYGIDPRLERSHGYRLIEKIQRGEPVTKQGGGKFVHVDDAAEATIAAMERDDASGRAFNMADCYARWADWARMACEVLGTEVEIDFSSPAEPKNVFAKDAVQSLGVAMDRGHEGIRSHLGELAETMAKVGA